MKKKDLFRIASMLVMILLLPFLSVLIGKGFNVIIPHPGSIRMQQVYGIIVCGMPIYHRLWIYNER
jgi:hypothetical protein